MKKLSIAVILFCAMPVLNGCNSGCFQKDEKSVSFISLKDGDSVSSPLQVQFSVKGMTVRPAGEDVLDKTSGHHHILIDDEKGYIEKGQVIAANEKSIHFGKGQTEATLTLSPGTHKLSLQFGDGAHLSYGKELSATIAITVVP